MNNIIEFLIVLAVALVIIFLVLTATSYQETNAQMEGINEQQIISPYYIK
jgi:heme/copper-type cytochrome/quinol oxidase subunit 3